MSSVFRACRSIDEIFSGEVAHSHFVMTGWNQEGKFDYLICDLPVKDYICGIGGSIWIDKTSLYPLFYAACSCHDFGRGSESPIDSGQEAA